MQFSERLIELAIQIKSSGVTWNPRPGHYVLDRHSIVERESPFQTGVYFVLNYPHFVKLAGGEDAFREKLVWLPTFEQTRELLRSLGVSNQDQQQWLRRQDAFTSERELESLYELVLQTQAAQ
ncbi:MAG: hypothetical protein AAFV88_03205 [Planctomycetota bacterium]